VDPPSATGAPSEDYGVEEAVKVVRGLGEGLVEATKHVKHRFRSEWVDQLVARYRARPGKPVVHLSDLPDQVIPTLSEDAKPFLQPYWDKLVAEYGSEWGAKHFRCVWDIMKSHRASRWSSLRLWRTFSKLTGLKVDGLENLVVSIRSASTGTSRVITHPRLPFVLDTPEGAKILGYRGDADHHTSAIHNMDEEVHEDYKRAILETVGRVPFTSTKRDYDGFLRTNVGIFVTMLATTAGLDNTVRQKQARNPIPAWFFLSTIPTKSSYLRTLFEAEGSPTRDAIKLSQATWIDDPRDPSIPAWPLKGLFNKLPGPVQGAIIDSPPPLLVSASLLLFQMGITSYLSPSKLAQTKSGCSAYWLVQIYRTINMRKYESSIGFVSGHKREKLSRLNRLHRAREVRPAMGYALSPADSD
jgi:hypothetical protein